MIRENSERPHEGQVAAGATPVDVSRSALVSDRLLHTFVTTRGTTIASTSVSHVAFMTPIELAVQRTSETIVTQPVEKKATEPDGQRPLPDVGPVITARAEPSPVEPVVEVPVAVAEVAEPIVRAEEESRAERPASDTTLQKMARTWSAFGMLYEHVREEHETTNAAFNAAVEEGTPSVELFMARRSVNGALAEVTEDRARTAELVQDTLWGILNRDPRAQAILSTAGSEELSLPDALALIDNWGDRPLPAATEATTPRPDRRYITPGESGEDPIAPLIARFVEKEQSPASVEPTSQPVVVAAQAEVAIPAREPQAESGGTAVEHTLPAETERIDRGETHMSAEVLNDRQKSILADLIQAEPDGGINYQTVSKWEKLVSKPDRRYYSSERDRIDAELIQLKVRLAEHGFDGVISGSFVRRDTEGFPKVDISGLTEEQVADLTAGNLPVPEHRGARLINGLVTTDAKINLFYDILIERGEKGIPEYEINRYWHAAMELNDVYHTQQTRITHSLDYVRDRFGTTDKNPIALERGLYKFVGEVGFANEDPEALLAIPNPADRAEKYLREHAEMSRRQMDLIDILLRARREGRIPTKDDYEEMKLLVTNRISYVTTPEFRVTQEMARIKHVLGDHSDMIVGTFSPNRPHTLRLDLSRFQDSYLGGNDAPTPEIAVQIPTTSVPETSTESTATKPTSGGEHIDRGSSAHIQEILERQSAFPGPFTVEYDENGRQSLRLTGTDTVYDISNQQQQLALALRYGREHGLSSPEIASLLWGPDGDRRKSQVGYRIKSLKDIFSGGGPTIIGEKGAGYWYKNKEAATDRADASSTENAPRDIPAAETIVEPAAPKIPETPEVPVDESSTPEERYRVMRLPREGELVDVLLTTPHAQVLDLFFSGATKRDDLLAAYNARAEEPLSLREFEDTVLYDVREALAVEGVTLNRRFGSADQLQFGSMPPREARPRLQYSAGEEVTVAVSKAERRRHTPDHGLPSEEVLIDFRQAAPVAEPEPVAENVPNARPSEDNPAIPGRKGADRRRRRRRRR